MTPKLTIQRPMAVSCDMCVHKLEHSHTSTVVDQVPSEYLNDHSCDYTFISIAHE